jgi:hypothetical protein
MMSKETLDNISLEENLLITQTPLGDMKYFYLFDENNIPVQLASIVNPKKLTY